MSEVLTDVEVGQYMSTVAQLTAAQDWRGLERACRLMLLRVAKAPGEHVGAHKREELERELWIQLIDVYEHRLGDLEKAIVPLELLAKRPPFDAALHMRLAELHVRVRKYPQAALVYEGVLAEAPSHLEAGQRLLSHHRRDGAMFRAAAVAEVLAFEGMLGESDRPLVDDYRRTRVGKLRAPLDDEGWRSLCHPDAQPGLTELLRLASPEPVTPPSAVEPAVLAHAHAALGVPFKSQASALDPELPLDARMSDGRSLREQLFEAGREATYRR